MSGSIACYKACQVISRLAQKGHEVQVVATTSALKFVGTATLEGLSGKPVISDLFQSGNVMDHIHLARWADLIVVAPATAHFMSKMAYGLGDDLATTLFLAHDFTKPFLVTPAMNTAMYRHPTTQDSIKKLLAMGVQVLESASGVLACGETGFGRLLEADQILEAIEKSLVPNLQKTDPPMPTQKVPTNVPTKVLVTAGGTEEKIDDVRVISNLSTGQTGYRICRFLQEAGYEVELLRAQRAHILEHHDVPQHFFTDYQSLEFQLKNLLKDKRFTHVIHAAAVSDYSVEFVQAGSQKISASKLDSRQDLTLHLKTNPKLLSKLKSFSSNPHLKVIGFKLTSHMEREEQIKKVEKLLQVADYVVHNDITEIDKAQGQHKFTFWGLKKPRVYENVEQLTGGLIQALSTEAKT